MGTRNLTMVQLDGEIKISQYGQWDGYPTGQGQTCVDFIKENLMLLEHKTQFKSELNKLRQATDEEIRILQESKDFTDIAPWISRNIGADILKYIFGGSVKYICHNSNSFEFGYDSLFCEFGYCLNLDNETLEIYKGFNKQKLKKGERFFKDDPDGDYYGIKMVKSYKFNDLTEKTMSDLESELYSEEED